MELPPQNASVYDKVDWCICQILDINEKLDKLINPPPIASKPWYTSSGVWFAIVLTLLVLAIIYIFYLSTLGYTTPYLPSWMK